MNTQIIVAGLRARPVRTAVGVLAVVLEVVLILLLVGMAEGSLADTANRVAGVGGEILVKNRDSSFLLGASPATLPFKIGDEIAKVDGVKAVAPVVAQMEQKGGLTMIWGVEPQSFGTMSGGLRVLEGGIFKGPDEALVDDRIAADRMLKVGGPLTVLGHDFKVSGIVQSGTTGARVLIPVETAGEMVSRPGWATFFYIKLNDKSRTKEIIEKIKKMYVNEETGEAKYDVIDADEWFSMMYASNADLLGIVFNGIVFLGVCIGVLVIFLTMYTTVSERTREIGILRAMGASKGFIVRLIIQESLFLCLIGAIAGIGASYLLTYPLKSMWPTLNILITPDWIVRAAIFALISGVIGSLYPAYKAASQDPIEALAYE